MTRVQRMAQRLSDALAKRGSAATQPTPARPAATQVGANGQSQNVQWRDAAERSRPRPEPARPKNPEATDDGRANASAQVADDPVPATQSAAANPLADLSQRALRRELVRRLRLSEQRPMRKGVAAVGLSLLANQSELNSDLLRELDLAKRKQLRRFHKVTRQLAADLLSGPGRLSRRGVMGRVRKLFNERPVTIQKLDLCRSVKGYGVYQPFDDHRFLAGQAHKVIVYVELDHFKTVERESRYEVKLKQKIMLFNASDGLVVWVRDPITIKDRSHNQRHDFFTVQLITLPERLTVGEYRLKVRIMDQHGGSVDETTVPMELVADRALAEGRKTE
jgi:hypothetical protein